MIIKEYNTNNYIFINKSNYYIDYHYYEELIRIQFNKYKFKQNTKENIINKLQKDKMMKSL
jgi:hypothetical protein